MHIHCRSRRLAQKLQYWSAAPEKMKQLPWLVWLGFALLPGKGSSHIRLCEDIEIIPTCNAHIQHFVNQVCTLPSLISTPSLNPAHPTAVDLFLAHFLFSRVHQPLGLVLALTVAWTMFFIPLALHRIPQDAGWQNPISMMGLLIGFWFTSVIYLTKILPNILLWSGRRGEGAAGRLRVARIVCVLAQVRK